MGQAQEGHLPMWDELTCIFAIADGLAVLFWPQVDAEDKVLCGNLVIYTRVVALPLLGNVMGKSPLLAKSFKCELKKAASLSYLLHLQN